MMQHRVPRQVDILGEAAEQMGGALGRGVAVADGLGIVAPVGVFTMAILARVAMLALAAHDIVLHEDQVAFLEALAAGEFLAALGDVADVLVAHDAGGGHRGMCVELHIRAADARDFHLHEGGVVRDVGHGEFADFGLAGGRADGCEDFLYQGDLLSRGEAGALVLRESPECNFAGAAFGLPPCAARPMERRAPPSGPERPA